MENLCRDLSQVLISKYYSRSIAGGGALMSDQEEIKALLREIRDLQKEHVERYKEFTQDVLARQKTSSEELEQARSEQRRHRDEMRSRRQIRIGAPPRPPRHRGGCGDLGHRRGTAGPLFPANSGTALTAGTDESPESLDRLAIEKDAKSPGPR
jgi:hypothetical protein